MWPKTALGSTATLSCSLLHESFVADSLISRTCHLSSNWIPVDLQNCVFKTEVTKPVLWYSVQHFEGTPSNFVVNEVRMLCIYFT